MMRVQDMPGWPPDNDLSVEAAERRKLVRTSFERAQQNVARLSGCPRHRFEQYDPTKPPQLGLRLLCATCGGHMAAAEARQYALGYVAAGGEFSDIFPERPDNVSGQT